MKCNVPRLTKKQLDAVNNECSRQFNQLLSKYNRESAVQIFYILHFYFGFGEKRLERFSEKLSEMQGEVQAMYDANGEDIATVCETHLKQSGIDVSSLLK